MKTLGRNSDNDIFLGAHGDLSVITGKQAQSSVIESIILTQKGELQFDEDAGIDYFGTVLQNPSFIEVWAAQVQSAIEALPFVSSVDDFEYNFDRASSTLYWTMKVENTDGETIDFVNKRLTLDGSPGIDIKWDNIYDKPSGTDEAIGVVANMQDAADGVSELKDKDTLRTVKNTINSLLFKPNDPEIEAEREIVFSFSRIPVGLILNVSNIQLQMEQRMVNGSATGQYYPCEAKASDGASIQTVTTGTPGVVELRFGSNTEHTIRKKGDFSITLKGRVVGIITKDSSLPLFLNARGQPFTYLTKIKIGKTVPLVSIADSAFRGCDNLREVIWNESSVDSISFGSSVFEGCQSLIGLQWLPKKLSSIGDYCFRGCTSLISLKGLESTDVTELPTGCFYGCRSLESAANLPEAVTALPPYAFANCTSLGDIDSLPDTVREFGSGCFMGCTGISSILYPPESLETIGEDCFKGCTSLNSVYLGASVTGIKADAFSGCTKLDNIFVDAETVPSLDGNPFSDAALGFIAYVQKSKLEQYQAASGWKDIALLNFGEYEFQMTAHGGLEIVGDTGNLSSSSIWIVDFFHGRVKTQRFTNDITKLPSHIYTAEELGGAPEVTVSIRGYITEFSGDSSSAAPFLSTREDGSDGEYPNLLSFHSYDAPLELIGDYAFYNCTSLFEIMLNKGDLTGEMPQYRIGDYAFAGCKSIHTLSWVRVNISSHFVKTEDDGTESYYPPFGVGCFRNSGVRSLDYNSDGVARDITTFAEYCFSGSELVNLDGIGGEDFVSLGGYCFYNCLSLKDISALIETGVQFLPDYCFAGCKTLESIHGIEYIISTRREWLDEDGDGNFTETRTTILGQHLFEGCIGLKSIEPLADAYFIPPIDWDEHQPPYTAGIEDLSDYMFAGCTLLKSLEGITDKIRTLGEHCFDGCKGLSYEREDGDPEVVPMTYPLMPLAESKVKELPYGCFANCTGLQNLLGLSGITSIGDRCFENCTGLVSTSGIGFDIKSLGAYVFSGCNSLSYVTCLAETPPSATAQTFSGIDLKSVPLYVREANVDRYSAAVGWNQFYNISHRTIKIGLDGISQITAAQAESSKVISKTHVGDDKFIPGLYFVEYGDGTRDSFIGDQRVTLAPHIYPTIDGQPQSGNYVLSIYGDVLEFGAPEQAAPSGADGHYQPSDGDGASPFLGTAAASISSLIVRTSYLEKIYPFSFCDCTSLTEADLEMSDIGEIGAFAFARCIWLPSVTAVNAVKIGDCAFLGCRLLGNVESFQTIIDVGYYCFYNDVVLTSLMGLAGAKTIGAYAFAGCVQLTSTDGLSSAVTICNNAFDGCSSLSSVSGFGGDIADIGDEAFKGCPVEAAFIASSVPPFIRENTFDAEVYDSDEMEVFVPYSAIATYKTQYPNISGSAYWDGSRFNYWSRFKDIKARSIRLHLEGIVEGERFYGSDGEVVTNGSWAISFGEGEQTLTFVGTASLPTYTFNTAGDKDILISGAIRGIRLKSSATRYPIFYTRETAYGTDKYPLTEIEGNRALELSSIGDNAFRNFTKLTSIKNLASVTTLGSGCFADCKALTDVSGLNGVNYIGASAFQGCSSLASLKGMSSVSEISASAFSGCTSLKKIDGLGMNVATIGANAFSNCPLSEVQMFSPTPPTVDSSAFNTIDVSTVPLYVLSTSVSDYADWGGFANVKSRTVMLTLKSVDGNVTLDGTGSSVESNTFWVVDFDYSGEDNTPVRYGFSENGSFPTLSMNVPGADFYIRVEGDVTKLSGDSDAGTPLFTTRVGDDVRNYLVELNTTDESNLLTIGDYAFKGCTILNSVSVPSVQAIGDHAFEGCTAIDELIGFYGVKSFGEMAFYGCSSLTEVTGLGVNVEEIKSKAFGGLPNGQITQIQIGTDVPPALALDAFEPAITYDSSSGHYDPDVPVFVPALSVSNYKRAVAGNNWQYFRSISSRSITLKLTNVPAGTTFNPPTAIAANVESESSWTISWGDGSYDVLSADTTSIPQHTYSVSGSYSVTIDGDIRAIGGYGDFTTTDFANLIPILWDSEKSYQYLTEVSCSSTLELTTIGASCFAGCQKLSKITGFDNVTTIGNAAFYNCKALSTIGEFKSLITIGDYGFAQCTSLSYVSCFPNIKTLGGWAFFGDYSLTNIVGLGSESGKTAGVSGNPPANFGQYCFAGCSISVIDSEYVVPPTITPTTFSADGPSQNVTVYVPVGSLSDYQEASVWREYLVRELCYIEFSFDSIYNGNVIFSPTGSTFESAPDGAVSIDWGDGTVSPVVGNVIPPHKYTNAPDESLGTVGARVTIRMKGDIYKIKGSSSGLPFLQVKDSEAAIEAKSDKMTSVKFFKLKNFTTIDDNAFYGCGNLTTILGVYVAGFTFLTGIGKRAFFRCEKLTDINSLLNASSVASLGDYCFARCLAIGDVTLPSSVKSIGTGCFSCVPYLANNTSLPSDGDIANTLKAQDASLGQLISTDLVGVKKFTWNHSGSGYSMNLGAFAGCTQMEVVGNFPTTLHDKTYSDSIGIAPFAFLNCRAITTFRFLAPSGNLPSGVKLGAYAFAYSGITDLSNAVYHQTSPKNLPEGIFLGCFGLTSLSGLPTGIYQYKGDVWRQDNAAATGYCFAYCTNLQTIDLPNTPSSGVVLGGGCFKGCRMVGTFTGVQIDVMGDSCFEGCGNLVGIDAPNVTEIGERCFAGCIGITELTGLPKVTVYPKNAYLNCTGITRITQFSNPSDTSITSITLEDQSFAGCANIRKIDLPYQFVVSTDGDPFSGINQKSRCMLTVPPAFYRDYKSDEYWRNFSVNALIEDVVIQFTMNIPEDAEDFTLFGQGTLSLTEPNGRIKIDWGDESPIEQVQGEDFTIDLNPDTDNQIKHDYSSSRGKTVTLSIGGSIEGISGIFEPSEPQPSNIELWEYPIGKLYPVFSTATTSDGGNIAYNEWLTKITLVDQSLKSIGNASFACSENLQLIDNIAGDGIETIGVYCCYKDKSLETLNWLPAGTVSSLGAGCFSECDNLVDINALAVCSRVTEIPNLCFYNTSSQGVELVDTTKSSMNVELPIPTAVETIGKRAFQNIKFAKFPTFNHYVMVKGYAFANNKYLTSLKGLKINYKTQTYGINMFQSCEGLTTLDDLDISPSVSYIPNAMFVLCTRLETIQALPSHIDTLLTGCFRGCSRLVSLDGTENIKSFGYRCFATCTSLENLEGSYDARIYSGPVTFGEECFRDCINLKTLSGISPNTESIGAGCFFGCENLIRLSDIDATEITSLPDRCFYGCKSLGSLNGIAANIVSLGESCFEGCTALTSMQGTYDPVLSRAIETVGKKCFYGCTGLISLDGISPSISSFGESCFEGCTGLKDITDLHNLTELTELPIKCFRNCSNLETIGKSETDEEPPVPLATTLTTIRGGCFQGCYNIVSIVLSRYEESESIPITKLDETETSGSYPADRVFEYGTLNSSAKFKGVFVPAGSVSAYSDATGWKNFNGGVIQEY